MSYSSLNSNIAGIPGASSFRNKIINGNFPFWQRGTSLSAGVGGYLADRWKDEASGATIAPSQQTFTVGQTDVPYEPRYYHRSVVVAGSGSGDYAYLFQTIEDVRTLAGQTGTVSFYAKADASKNMALEFEQYFGATSGYTNVTPTTIALTTSWLKFTVTVAFPSASGKTITAGTNKLYMIFWFDAGSSMNSNTNSLGHQSGTFDIAQVQLEAGSIATPFEQRPYGVELALCQRHCYKLRLDGSTYDTVALGIAETATTSIFPVYFPVSMYGAPTVTLIGAAMVSDLIANTADVSTVTVRNSPVPYSMAFLDVVTASLSGTRQVINLSGKSSAAGSGLLFTAEI